MTALLHPLEQTSSQQAWNQLLKGASEVTDYTQLLKLCRSRRRLAASGYRPHGAKMIKVALLSGATTEPLEELLVLAIECLGLSCQLHRSGYNSLAQEMLEASSNTTAFSPDVSVVVNTPANVPAWPEPGDNLERVNRLVDEVCGHWLDLCSRLHDHTRCEIVLNNFHPLPVRPLGNLGAKLPWEANNFLRRLNRALGDRAPAYVHINDVETLSAVYGIHQWLDARYWFHAKQPVSFPCLVPYVRNTARIIGALFGRTAKCLVLDLDNTLWGGEVGDDGPEGIRIGEGDAVAEAFKAFQQYVLQLKRRGVLLAICSKNDEANALAPFTQRTEMILKRDDFVAFKANWRPKPDNLRSIADELNLGLDALVFVDDNPAERELVRQELPDVKVVELTNDPADYPRLLDEAGCFEIVALSSEDQLRTRQYQENDAREQSRLVTTDYASYLVSLRQRAVIGPFEEASLDRITQLINKSNQFNLTTRRLTRSQVEALMRDPASLTACIRLADRFGDNGLIGVFSAHQEQTELWIDLWLMSCRVLNRGVEQLLCNYVVARARARGAQNLCGIYLPTPKNRLVRDHYQALGFSPLGDTDNGESRWRLDLAQYQPFEVAIESVEDY